MECPRCDCAELSLSKAGVMANEWDCPLCHAHLEIPMDALVCPICCGRMSVDLENKVSKALVYQRWKCEGCGGEYSRLVELEIDLEVM